MSLRAWLVRRRIQKIFRPARMKSAPPVERLAHILAGFKSSESILPQPPAKTIIEPVEASHDGTAFRGEWVYEPGVNENHIIFYTHGGAYVWGSPREYRDLAWRLSKASNAKVFLLDYTLAPKAQCPVQINEGLAAYDYIRSTQPDAQIVMAGDSAGGNITVAMAVAIRDSGRPAPQALSLIAPGIDMTGGGDSVVYNAEKDVMLDPEAIGLVAKQYAGDMPLDDPRCSPLFASHEGLPPILAQVGSEEILLDDTLRLQRSVRGSGGTFHLHVWPKMHHVWHMSANMVPEGRKAIAEMAAHFKENWSEQARGQRM